MTLDVEIILAAILVLFFADMILYLRVLINKANQGRSPRRRKIEEAKCQRHLDSRFRLRRIRAAVELGGLGTESARLSLEKALEKEKDFPVRLYIANALADIGDARSLPALIASLLGAHRWYRSKVNMLIADFGGRIQPLLSRLAVREETEIRELLVDVSSVYVSNELKEYLFALIDGFEPEKEKQNAMNAFCIEKQCCGNCKWGRKTSPDGTRHCEWKGIVADDYHCRKYSALFVNINRMENHEKLVLKAAETAGVFYFNELTDDKYLRSPNKGIQKIAVRALGNIDSKEAFLKLKEFLADETTAGSALLGITGLIRRDSFYIRLTMDSFKEEKNEKVREYLAEALSGKIEYFIMRLTTSEKNNAAEIIRQLLALGKTSELIGFLNKNKDLDIENELLAIVRKAAEANELTEKEFCMYLSDRLLAKAGLVKCARLTARKEHRRDPAFVRILYFLLAVTLVIFPVIYLLSHYTTVFAWPILLHAKVYVLDFNYFLVFYSLLINFIYLVLLLFSRLNVTRQSKLWSCKDLTMLFRKRMLPGVSIIAPAYNEEAVIVESANSLLNLKYPDYELIIVNDGSADNTLNVLIGYFDLKRVDFAYEKKLNTEPIRGVYRNPSFPKLTVVDKENGGKADSLNAGIVISQKEYFCCIDSDSLLEDEALLKLASQTLDEGTETPALGGNIFPINGCKVQRGYISEIRIPDSHLARFQTIEYIRAFMAGRLGWAYINSLLIISGAFGLFRKERVIAVGGYLTSNEKYGKDTVGEDMELVVRIARDMREKGLKYRINYCYNANCWTEVPEQIRMLKKQRYRWHRGLIEILHFHRETLFNPEYGQMGVISMPYFFLFEMIGPLIEIQGYLMIVTALFLGILNWEIALLLFLSSIFLGVFVSIASLEIAERDCNYYSYGDVTRLVFYAIVENFGIRQLFSLWRTIGYLKLFAKPQGWGTQTRKGFAAK